MARKKQILQDVSVIDIADKGQAIGKTSEGEVVIVMGGAVPGDVIDLRVHRKKKGLKHGYVQQINSYSPNRVEAVCDHFGVCGGCKWQNLNYEKQIALKEQAVRQAIKRIGNDETIKVARIRKATNIYNYRNKLEYSFSTKRWLTPEEIQTKTVIDDRPGLGFHIAGAFDKVLQIDQCHLQDDFSNQIRNKVGQIAKEKGWSYYDIRNNNGLLRNLMIRNTSTGEWMVTIIFGERDEQKINEVFEVLIEKFPSIHSWHSIINTKMNSSLADLDSFHVGGAKYITEELNGIKYQISPKSFFQTNTEQAKTLYDVALDYARIGPDDVVYDLYTGTGSIALYLAASCKSVVGIEVIPDAISDARSNADLNGITNADFVVGDVKDILNPTFTKRYGSPDVLITDPPRAGMHEEVVRTLLQIGCPRIVYISCNPSTQARDIALLKASYELLAMTPVDMFPHTSHIESIAVLELCD